MLAVLRWTNSGACVCVLQRARRGRRGTERLSSTSAWHREALVHAPWHREGLVHGLVARRGPRTRFPVWTKASPYHGGLAPRGPRPRRRSKPCSWCLLRPLSASCGLFRRPWYREGLVHIWVVPRSSCPRPVAPRSLRPHPRGAERASYTFCLVDEGLSVPWRTGTERPLSTLGRREFSTKELSRPDTARHALQTALPSPRDLPADSSSLQEP